MNIEKNYLRNFLHDDIIAMGFDENMIDTAIDALVESIEDSLPKLLEAINNEKKEDIRFHAHTLKGTFSNFTNEPFTKLSKEFKNMETTAKDDGDIETIKSSLNIIENLTLNWLKF